MFRSPARARLAHPRGSAILLAAAATSYLGDEIAAVALAIAVHDDTGSGFAVAAVVLATLLPLVVLSPLTGWLVDRVETTRLLSLLAGAQAAVVLLLTQVTALTGRLALIFLLSSATAATATGLLALAPTAAGKTRAKELLGYLAVASRASAALGPLVGGLLVKVAGVRGALLADAATFVLFSVAFLLLGFQRRPEPLADQASEEEKEPHPALRGMAMLWQDLVLRRVVGVLVLAIVFIGISYVATVFFAKDVLDAGNLGVGLLLAAQGAGMTAGSYGIRWVATGRLASLALAVPAVAGAGFLLAAAVPLLGVAVVGFTVSGLASGLGLTAMRALVVERVPDGLLGRVFAAEAAIGTTGELLALALGGALVSLAGARPALWVAGVGAVAASLAALVLGWFRAVGPPAGEAPEGAVIRLPSTDVDLRTPHDIDLAVRSPTD
jgi:MFS family permease